MMVEAKLKKGAGGIGTHVRIIFQELFIFSKYKKTVNKIARLYRITSSDFDVRNDYKMQLIQELKKAKNHLAFLDAYLSNPDYEAHVKQLKTR
jgi:hypothetical protein